MNLVEFQKRVGDRTRPLVVDLWAPWCAPCRAMEPALRQISQKYHGEVDVLKINADESPEVLRSLGVMGIPTLMAYAGGNEILRRTGMQSVEALDVIFDAALHQRKPGVFPLAPVDRVIRTAAGLALLVLGWVSGQSILLLTAGGVLLFSAFYDRCPVYRMIAPQLAALFRRSKDN